MEPRARAARALHAALQLHSEEIPVALATLAGTPRSYARAAVYERGLSYPSRERPISEVFPTVDALLAAVLALDPPALEVALVLLSWIEPEEAVPPALELLASTPWRRLGGLISLVLSRSTADEAFAALVDISGVLPDTTWWLRTSAYPGGCERVLEALRAALPPWERVDYPAAWPDAASRTAWRAELDALRERDGYRRSDNRVHTLVGFLGVRRCEAAWPLLVELYTTHPSSHVHLCTGHALVAFGDRRSLEILASRLGCDDRWTRHFAVKALLHLDPSCALDRMGGPELPSEVASEALQLIERDAGQQPSRGLAKRDERWLDVAVRLLRDRNHRDVADGVVGLYPDAAVRAAKRRRTAPRPAAVALPRKGQLRRLYAGGQHRAAWEALAALGPAVRTPRLQPEAYAIALDTMRRVRERLEHIVAVLRDVGYRFADPDGALVAPAPDVVEQLDALEARAGVLPLSLRAALEVVGSCSLAGTGPDWSGTAHVGLAPQGPQRPVWYTDPLELAPLPALLEEAADAPGTAHGVVELTLAPDAVGKAGFSGGRCWVDVPDQSADATLRGLGADVGLVPWLRTSLAWGGFPGLAEVAERPRGLLERLVTDR